MTISSFVVRVKNSGFRVQGLQARVEGADVSVKQGLGFRAQGLGFGAHTSQGVRFRAKRGGGFGV